MSRKDFELIARTIKEMPPEVSRTELASRIASALVGHSATFDRHRFLAACVPKVKEAA